MGDSQERLLANRQAGDLRRGATYTAGSDRQSFECRANRKTAHAAKSEVTVKQPTNRSRPRYGRLRHLSPSLWLSPGGVSTRRLRIARNDLPSDPRARPDKKGPGCLTSKDPASFSGSNLARTYKRPGAALA